MSDGYYWELRVDLQRGHKYNPAQPRVPAGNSRGGQWTSGGFIKGTQNAPDGLYNRYDLDKPSEGENQRFLKHINQDIHEDIKALWPEDGRLPILAKSRDPYTAYHKGLWVVIPQGEVDGPSATHEFLHHLVSERFGREWPGRGEINKYNPSTLFQHAEWAFTGSKKNEDLTMMLGFYDPDKKRWAQNIIDSGEMWNAPDPAIIAAKVKEASRFLKEITK